MQSMKRLLLLSMSVRLVLDISMGVFSPYLPVIARGLGVSVAVMGILLSVRGAFGLSSPIFGVLIDRLGARRILMSALALLAVGTGMLSTGPAFALAALAFGLIGLGQVMFFPALQAYISNQVAYNVRGRILGAIELSWSITSIILLPLLGVIIAITSWRAPFIIIALGAALSIPAIASLSEERARVPRSPGSVSIRQIWHAMTSVLRGNYSGIASVLMTLCMYFAGINVLLVYGAWLEAQFGLAVQQIGLLAIMLGLADLCGSSLSSAFIDRVGKRRAVLAGLAVSTCAYLILPFGDSSLLVAMTGLMLMRLGFEFSIVSNISLVSEQAPTQRGAMLSWAGAAGALAGTIAGVTGSNLWLWRGMTANAILAAGVALMGLYIGLRYVIDGEPHAGGRL
jgi:predicted MFS family arabinose efflux permease